MPEGKVGPLFVVRQDHVDDGESPPIDEVVYVRKVYTFWNQLSEGWTMDDVDENDAWQLTQPFRSVEGTGDDRFDLSKVRDLQDEFIKRRKRLRPASITSNAFRDEPLIRVHEVYRTIPKDLTL